MGSMGGGRADCCGLTHLSLAALLTLRSLLRGDYGFPTTTRRAQAARRAQAPSHGFRDGVRGLLSPPPTRLRGPPHSGGRRETARRGGGGWTPSRVGFEGRLSLCGPHSWGWPHQRPGASAREGPLRSAGSRPSASFHVSAFLTFAASLRRALGPQTSGPGRGISAGLDPPHRCRLARWQRDGSHLPSGAGVSQHHLGPAKPVSLFLGFSASSPGAAAAAARRCGDLSLSFSSLFSSTLQVSHFLDSVSS